MLIRTNITGIGDPFILREGDTYYAYATSAADGFRYFVSKDLIRWSEGGYCYRNSSWAENCFWAPEVYKFGDRYYMLYTGRWKQNHSLRLGLAVSASPCGPFEDVKEGPLFDLGYAVIDGTLFAEGNARYLYFVRDCSENIVDGLHVSEIYGAPVGEDFSFLAPPVRLTSPDVPWETARDPLWRWNEGPALLKHGGNYYLNYSVNCYSDPEYSIACAVAPTPLGPFVKDASNPVLRRREGDFSGPGHNSFFRDAEGYLCTAFHIHTDPLHPSGDRRMCIARAGFGETGKFFIDPD